MTLKFVLLVSILLSSCTLVDGEKPSDYESKPHRRGGSPGESSAAVLSSSSVAVSSSSTGVKSSSSVSTQTGVIPGPSVNYLETYETVVIGTQTWFQRNLNYAVEGSKCYDDDEINCDAYGRLYNWATAATACPQGWHLPSNDEWTTLTDYVGGYSIAGTKLKATSGWEDFEGKSGNGTDNYGFAAMPGGLRYNGRFCDVGTYGGWWSASEGYFWGINYNGEYIGKSNYEDFDLLSVRCLKND